MRILIALMLVVWMIFTMILCFSLIGISLLVQSSYKEKSTWMQMGADLSQRLIK